MGLRGGIMSGMTTRQDELSQFLKSRRARLAPADVAWQPHAMAGG